jgi:hypothetical protein
MIKVIFDISMFLGRDRNRLQRPARRTHGRRRPTAPRVGLQRARPNWRATSPKPAWSSASTRWSRSQLGPSCVVGALHLFGPVVQRRQTRDERRGKSDRRGPHEHQLHGPVRGGRPGGAVFEAARALGAPSTFGDRIHRSVGTPRWARSGVLSRPPRSQSVLGSSEKGA